MKKIEAKIIADSISPQGHRITSMLLTYPRFIHGEVMTHRMFSRNSASSRAIPFNKMVKMVKEDPFIPIAWQKDHKGMQGNEYFNKASEIEWKILQWQNAKNEVIKQAKALNAIGVTKQLCNRLLEPFMWHTTLVTATQFENFFELRCPKIYHAADGKYYRSLKDWNNVDREIQWVGLTCMHPENKSQAEIHIQALAESMWDAMNESIPKQLLSGQWHIPFGDKITIEDCFKVQPYSNKSNNGFDYYNEVAVKIATARCARTSYMTFDGEINYEKDIQLHDNLLKDRHMSPMEHCAECRDNNNWYANFKGWQSYRNIIENE